MIAVWMAYCTGIGLAFVVVGYALERGLYFAGKATRWAWVIALLGSFVVPVAAWPRPEAFATFPAPIPVAVESSGSFALPATSTTSTILDQPASRPLSLSDFDAPLRWGWGLASVAMLFVLAVAAARLVSQRRRWRNATVDGRLVLVSRNIGPAVVGLWRRGPRVVLPEWALALPAHDRELMLAHEEQHVRAGDPALLAAGFLALLIAPWNLALWWQWRRLRLTVEIDCDARVLAQGRSAPAYGQLLLQVGQRRGARLLGAAALGEPASFLESRIRRMLATMPRRRWLGVAAAAGAAIGAAVGACETPRPVSPTVSSASAAQLGQEIADRMSVRDAERLRRWVAENAGRTLPSILEPSGPAMDAYLIHDSRLHVYRSSLVTMYYLNGQRPNAEIGMRELQQALPSYSLNDGWAVIDPRGLRGLVRDNVRLIRINHDPQPQDTAQRTLGAVDTAAVIRQAEQIRRLARQDQPEVFGRGTAPTAVAVVMDGRGTVLGHAARTGVRGNDVRTVDGVHEDCLEVLTRLLPRFKDAQWSQTGCTNDPQPDVVIYWGIALHP